MNQLHERIIDLYADARRHVKILEESEDEIQANLDADCPGRRGKMGIEQQEVLADILDVIIKSRNVARFARALLDASAKLDWWHGDGGGRNGR